MKQMIRHAMMIVILVLMTPQVASAQQEAFFIYQNDGDFNAFLYDDIDSIVFSCIGLDSLIYDEPVVQEVYRSGSVSRIALETIDSIKLRAPEPIFKDDIFHLTAEHIPYITQVNDMTITFKGDTPEGMLPKEDQIVVSDIFEEPFSNGFAGRVIIVDNGGFRVEVVCEEVAITDVYEQLVCVGKSLSIPKDSTEAKVHVRRLSGEGVTTFDMGKLSWDVADFLTVSDSPDLTLDYAFNIKWRQHPVVKLKLTGVHEVAIDFKMEKKFGDNKPTEPKWLGFIPIPTGVVGLYCKVNYGVFYEFKGGVELKGTIPITLTHVNGFNWDSYGFNAINDFQSKFDMPELTLQLKGSAQVGLAAQLSLGIMSEKVVGATLTLKMGPKLSAAFEMNAEGVIDWNRYKLIKDTKITMELAGEFSAGYKICGKSGEFESLKLPIKISNSFGKKEWYLMPEFTTPQLKYINDEMEENVKGRFTTDVSRNLMLPVYPGIGVYDKAGNTIEERFSTEKYWNLNAFGEESKKPTPYTFDIEGMKKDQDYIVRPVFKLLGGRFMATPKTDFKAQSLNVSKKLVYAKAGRSETVDIMGSTGTYLLENDNPYVADCYVIGHVLHVDAKKEGRCRLKVKARDSQESVSVLVDVTGYSYDKDNGQPLSASTGSDIIDKMVSDMVFVEGGTFQMGATVEQEGDAEDNEKPVHPVKLDSYYINKYELTQDIWEEVMGENPSTDKGAKRPVTNVNREQIEEFLNKLNAITGYTFRLPTEAEWEFAARGGGESQGYKYAGSNDVNEVFSGQGTHYSHTSVGRKNANELGLYDMSGNVWEYCNDIYNDFAYDPEIVINPRGPSFGNGYVIRGGGVGYYDNGVGCGRVSKRGGSSGGRNVGFRLAYSVRDNLPLTEFEQTYNSMVEVEGGTLTLGATEEQNGAASDNEYPQHPVKISPFMISKTEVTQELWYNIMRDTPSADKGAKRPVTNVSWDQVQEFISRLNTQTGLAYRLPTEAEWEYAARGGAHSLGFKYAGSDNVGEVFSGQGTHYSHTSVGRKKANELGLYDMSGNVWEYCSDIYNDFAYDRELRANPIGPIMGSNHSIRGGGVGYYDNGEGCGRVSSRGGSDGGRNIGFRLALSNKNSEGETELQRLLHDMVFVEGGIFVMGDNEHDDNERPAHPVILSSYYISKFEVTQDLWKLVMDEEPSTDKGAKRPVTDVSWESVQEFITRLNAMTGYSFRLPTEAEWEYAARGGIRSKHYAYSGSDNVDDVFSGQGTHYSHTSVGRKKANELGLYDMSGNVWEYCNDWYNAFAYDVETVRNPQGPQNGSAHSIRGGGVGYYDKGGDSGRVSKRGGSNGGRNVGFRLAASSLNPNTPPSGGEVRSR